jgi:hypothetical protein
VIGEGSVAKRQCVEEKFNQQHPERHAQFANVGVRSNQSIKTDVVNQWIKAIGQSKQPVSQSFKSNRSMVQKQSINQNNETCKSKPGSQT